MKIHFNGAARTVTGSQFLLEINGKRLLLECGLFQGKRGEYYERNRRFRFDVKSLDAVILSHAHIDHSGNLPNLVKNGLEARIHATTATVALADVMLRDSGHIQEADAEYVNFKRAKRGDPPVEPLYTAADAARTNAFFDGHYYNELFLPVPGVVAHFVDAGHILGAAAVVLDIEEHGRKFRLWFSGDIGRKDLPITCDPVLPSEADYMIMECTYGDKPHRDPEEAFIEFRDVVVRTVERGGKVVIPSFAVGRTQELVYNLNRMMENGSLPPIDIYIDSPLAINATEIFSKFPDYFDTEARQYIHTGKNFALYSDHMIYTPSVEESKKINDINKPIIIISASGMAETGRILHHLRNNVENPKNTVVIVSWQAPDTLGRRLVEQAKEIKIFGEVFPVRCEIATIGGLSAHAGQKQLREYANAVNGRVKQLFLVHGEQKPYDIFRQLLVEDGFRNIAYPNSFDMIEVED